MMNRIALVLLGLSLGCGSAAAPTSPTSPPFEAGDPASSSAAGGKSSPTSPTPETKTAPVLSFAEAKKRAEAAWQTAETEKTSAPAWDYAGEALAIAAQAAAEDPAAAAPLLKGALAAWRNSEKTQPSVALAGTDKQQRTKLSRRETLRVAVLVQLAAHTDPQSPELAMIEYRHGRVLWKYAHYQEAAAHFLRVVEQFPDRQEAKYASSLVLDALLRAGALDELEKQANRMLQNKALTSAHPDLVETLALVRHQARRAKEMAASP